MTNDSRMQGILSDATDALLAGENLEALYGRYAVSDPETRKLLEIAHRLHGKLTPVEPRSDFAMSLKSELLGEKRTGVLWKLRRMPADAQLRWAAFAAISGGFLIILRQFFFGEENPRRAKKNVAQD
jgi:hypothetical protein